MPRTAHALEQPIALSDEDLARLRHCMRAEFQLVWRLLRRLGITEVSAADEAQRVFLIFARKLAEVRPDKERAFLVACATRVAANARRAARQVQGREVSEADSPEFGADFANQEHLLEEKRRRDLLDTLLAQLPSEQRVVVVLAEIEGHSSAEIAVSLGIAQGTVKSRLRLGKQRLHDLANQRQQTIGAAHAG